MVYAHDKWVELPTKDIYDTQMMLAAINAAKDMYDKGLKQMEDFYKTYGDFTSPFAKDIEDYNNLVTKPVQDAMNYMYENGIDPTRSAEGRAMLSRLIYSVPMDKVNKLRESAETGREYLKNLSELQAKGLYDPAQNNWWLLQQGIPSFDDFSTLDNGSPWSLGSPMHRITLQELTYPSVKDLDDSVLTKEQVESLGYKYRPGYDYTGRTEDMLRRTILQGMPGIEGNPWTPYFKDVARRELIAEGNLNPTQDEINKRFEDNAVIANKQMLRLKDEKANPYALASFSARQSASRSSGGGGGSYISPSQAFIYDFRTRFFKQQVAGLHGDPTLSNWNQFITGGGQKQYLQRQASLFGHTVNEKNKKPTSAYGGASAGHYEKSGLTQTLIFSSTVQKDVVNPVEMAAWFNQGLGLPVTNDGSIQLTKGAVELLTTPGEIVNNMYGNASAKPGNTKSASLIRKKIAKNIDNGYEYYMVLDPRVRTLNSFDLRNNKINNRVRVRLVSFHKEPDDPNNGNSTETHEVRKDEGYVWVNVNINGAESPNYQNTGASLYNDPNTYYSGQVGSYNVNRQTTGLGAASWNKADLVLPATDRIYQQ